MIILGVCNATDSGAALIIDGKVVSAANEERFVRKKLIRTFPKNATEYVLKSQGLTIADVDYVGCGAWHGMDDAITLPRFVEDIYSQTEAIAREQVLQRIKATTTSDSNAKTELFEGLKELGIPEERIICCDHHYSHALTAFYPSPFEEAIVFTADGRGDFRSVTLWEGSREKGLQLVNFSTELASPGALYGFVTKIIGFIPDRHEGKVTGLAARGKMTEAYELLKLGFYFDKESGRLQSSIGDYYRPFLSANLPALENKLSQFSREDIAYAVQTLLEETLSAFLMHHIGNRPDNSVNLCLAGGCMSNVKLNYELGKLKPIKNVYVFPHMGDGGNALGGAINVAIKHAGLTHLTMPTAYLGPEYSDKEIQRALEAAELPYQTISPNEKAEMVAKLIADGKIIGWFQGRLEYGPRALGSRSILASPTDPSINDSLNNRLKRSEFMPFAPVTIDELAPQCYVGWTPEQVASHFMTICYQCYPIMAERCSAVVHVDNSARPQVVFRDKNPDYYDLVKYYYELTGNPAIINTSFNHHEEPIINTPHDAVRSLLKGNVDVLVAGNFRVDLADVQHLMNETQTEQVVS